MTKPAHAFFPLLLAWSPAFAQSGAGTSPVPSGAGTRPGAPSPGAEVPKPGGGTFFQDAHRNGRARALYLEEIVAGRLVDVHGLAASGAIDPTPVFRDFLVGETIQSDGVDYVLFPSPSTQVEHLLVLRRPGAPEPSPGAGTFSDLVRAAERAAARVEPRGPSAPLVTQVPRNAALGLRFSDLLEDGAAAANALLQDVQLFVDPALATPFGARLLFDANHGGLAQGAFHSTRVLVDLTVSEFDASEVLLPVNPLGLPESTADLGASFRLALPTRLSPGTGQLTRLTNLAGQPLATTDNGPIDDASPTRDVVRAARAGNAADPNAGFLLDLFPPTVLGRAAIAVTAAADDPAGTPGFSFLADWTFQTPCASSPRSGDAVMSGNLVFEVIQNGPPLGPGNTIQGARVRLAQHSPVSAGALLGLAALAARLRPEALESPCWFHILPQPALPPGAGLSTSSVFSLQFSEPMRGASIDPYDNFRLVRGPLGTPADAGNTVVVDVSSTATAVTLQPVLPLEHSQGTATRYHIELLAGAAGPTDLAGNALAHAPSAGLRIDPADASETSAGFVLRFAAPDEVPGPGADLRGNFTLDAATGTLHPRPPVHFSAVIDRTQPVPSLMIPLPGGVQTPLSPFGSKLHQVWRHCDVGWSVLDESKYDVDVEGLDWSPRFAAVVNDFFPEFEIRLAHSARLPDEDLDRFLLPKYPDSGLYDAPHPYTDNILVDPRSPQRVVHERALGYAVNAADLFLSSTGTAMMPYPLNRGGGPYQTYTWRDTSVLAQAGPDGAGVPLDIEVGPPLFLESDAGSLAPSGAVPSIGLPLLMEFRTYPTELGVGLNALDASLAINSSPRPNFRAFSSGGITRGGQVVKKHPDAELVPSGGVIGGGLPAENTAYIGQLDLVVRVSRAHSAWFDTAASQPDFAALQFSPAPSGAASVQVEFRGATGFSGTGGSEGDAAQLDAYGNVTAGSVSFQNGDSSWHGALDDLDGALHPASSDARERPRAQREPGARLPGARLPALKPRGNAAGRPCAPTADAGSRIHPRRFPPSIPNASRVPCIPGGQPWPTSPFRSRAC